MNATRTNTTEQAPEPPESADSPPAARRNPARSSPTLNVVLVSMFAALTAVLGLVPPITIGVLPVPFTAQTLGVMLAGAVLGPWRGALSQVLLLVLVAAGLPLLAGGRGGLGVLFGPTGGYAIGWTCGALVIGWGASAWFARTRHVGHGFGALLVATLVGGILVVHLVGVAWLATVTGIGFRTALMGDLVFVPADVTKAVLATLIAVVVHRSYRGLLR